MPYKKYKKCPKCDTFILPISKFCRKHFITEEYKKNLSLSRVGKKFRLGKKQSEETKRKISIAHKGKKLSEKTKQIMRLAAMGNKRGIKNLIPGGFVGRRHKKEHILKISETHKKEKNPNWKGGITPINIIERMGLNYRLWRISVYKRDLFCCRLCNRKCKKNDICAHHIKSFSKYPELRFVVDNGITLCRSCHSKLHFNKKILLVDKSATFNSQ